MSTAAKETYAHLQVHASKKPELKSPVEDMKTKMQELDQFVDKANVLLAQWSMLNTDSADAEVRDHREKGQAFLRIADTHKAGMMVAKKRWEALLGR